MYVCLWSGSGAIPQNTNRLLGQLAGILVDAGKRAPDFRFLGSLLFIGQLIDADLSISDFF